MKAGRHLKSLQTDPIMSMHILPRMLTRKEARIITNEVVNSGIKDPELRFMLAVVKSIQVTNNSPHLK